MHIDGHPRADAASGSAPASGRRLPYSTARFVVAAIGVLDPLGGIVNNWASVDTAFRSAHAKSNRLLCTRRQRPLLPMRSPLPIGRRSRETRHPKEIRRAISSRQSRRICHLLAASVPGHDPR